MKNTMKLLGIIALSVLIGFSMAACDDDVIRYPPSTPEGVRASAVSSSSITVSWNAVSGATEYEVYRSSSASGAFFRAGSPTTTSYTDTGLSASTTYYYKVVAYNSYGRSDESNIVDARTSSGGGGEPIGNNPFINTTWSGPDWEGDTVVLSFASTTWRASWPGLSYLDDTGTYTFSGNTAFLQRGSTSAGKAIIFGNKLIVSDDDSSYTYTLTKQ
jgi:hypothetical protein